MKRHVPQGLVATALKDGSSAAHLTKQIEDIGKGVGAGLGASWTAQLGKNYATDIIRGLGGAGIAPDISKRMHESLGIAGLVSQSTGGIAGLADAGLMNQRLAKQLRDITGTGLAQQRAGVLTTGGFLAGEHLKAFKAMESVMAEMKHMKSLFGVRKTIQDMMGAGLLGAVDQQLLRSPLAAKGFFPADRLASVFDASNALAVTKLAEIAIAPLAKHIASLGGLTDPPSSAPLGSWRGLGWWAESSWWRCRRRVGAALRLNGAQHRQAAARLPCHGCTRGPDPFQPGAGRGSPPPAYRGGLRAGRRARDEPGRSGASARADA